MFKSPEMVGQEFNLAGRYATWKKVNLGDGECG